MGILEQPVDLLYTSLGLWEKTRAPRKAQVSWQVYAQNLLDVGKLCQFFKIYYCSGRKLLYMQIIGKTAGWMDEWIEYLMIDNYLYVTNKGSTTNTTTT